jgi:non-ribosomal peptide synthetase component F
MISQLQNWVTLQAETRPHAPAVVAGDERVNYGQLEALSNQLARLLKDAGCTRSDRIGLLMEKSPVALIAVLAIHKANCILVPLDPATPPPMLAAILDSCSSRYLLAGGSVVGVLDRLFARTGAAGTVPVGWLGCGGPAAQSFAPKFLISDARAYSAAPFRSEADPREPARILYMFDASGTPRGTVATHANIIAFVEWARRYFGISTADRVAGQSSLHADLSAFDIFGTFAAGGELHLIPTELNERPHRVVEFVRASELTQWTCDSSILDYAASFDLLRSRDFPTLKRLLWSSDAFSTSSLIYLMNRLPHVTFTRLYGRTETTIASGYHTIRNTPANPAEEIPIGAGCDGDRLFVLDASFESVPDGEIGDLYVGGAGVSPGYWNDPELTDGSFVEHSVYGRLFRTGDLARVGRDGLVYFQGRAQTCVCDSMRKRVKPRADAAKATESCTA